MDSEESPGGQNIQNCKPRFMPILKNRYEEYLWVAASMDSEESSGSQPGSNMKSLAISGITMFTYEMFTYAILSYVMC